MGVAILMGHLYTYTFIIDPLQVAMEELAMMGNVGVVTTVCAVPSVTMQKGCLFPSYLTARLYDVVRVDSFLSLTKMVEG